jgi:hypothetical protein
MTKDTGWIGLIKDCIIDLGTYKVNIIFSNNESIQCGDHGYKIGGYWDGSDSDNLTLACAVGTSIHKWGSVFAHEYCHFVQWKEKSDEWVQYNKYVKGDVYNKIFSNTLVNEQKMIQCLDACKQLELDCEKRTVELFKKHKVPIDLKEYIKGANAYIHFYNHARYYREWYDPFKVPYHLKNLYEHAPSSFRGSYDKIPRRLGYAFKKYYPVKKHNNIM